MEQYNQFKIAYTVKPPLKATSLQRPFFFGRQSIHSLLFQPLYNGHLSTMATFFCPQATVAVVERFNCNFPSLAPGSVLWEKGEKIGVGEKKKIGERSEPRGSLGRGNGLPPFPLPRIPLRSPIFFLFLTPFFSFFPHCGAWSQAINFQVFIASSRRSDRRDGARRRCEQKKNKTAGGGVGPLFLLIFFPLSYYFVPHSTIRTPGTG